MEDERFTVEQVAALKAAIYPFVEVYRIPMDPEDVELLALAVLGATPDRSLDELRERSERLIAEELGKADRRRQAMRRDPMREQSH